MKYKIGGFKKLCSIVLSAFLAFSAIPATSAIAATTYYNQVTQETVSRGVVYEKSSRMTDAGIQNVHVLTVDLKESTLEFKAVESATEYGLKETAQKLLTDNGAIAGVNGDFFGLAGNYSASFGPVVVDGEFISGGTSLNHDASTYAAFFMDESGNPFLDYFKMTAVFSNAATRVELASVNKVTAMTYPICFDKNAAESTAQLDARFTGLVKLVVEDDEITYISRAGETVKTPEDGYLIIMSSDYFSSLGGTFVVGDSVNLNINSSVDLDAMEVGFGGGSMLLSKGNETAASSVASSGRQPRTAFGVSRDGATAIFMVVDGRGDSIGATHSELATLMKEYGAYEAIHLDGGGSSTMVAQTIDDTSLEVKNTVSEGSARRVISAVGVFQNGESDEILQIGITPSLTRTVPNKSMDFVVYGLDEYYNRIEIPANEVALQAVGVEGTWNGYTFTPSQSGTFSVTAVYNGMSAVTSGVVSGVTRRLSPANTAITLTGAGQTATIAMQVVDTEGFSHWVSSTTAYEVADTSVGTMTNNVFTALKEGATYIKCTRDGQTSYISVTVGSAKAVTTPAATAAADPLQATVNKANDGAYYLNIIGGLVYSGEASINQDTYINARTVARNAVDSNAEVAIYGSSSSIVTTPKLDTLSWTGNYRFLNRGGTSLAMVTAAKGGIRSTDPSQWTKLTNDLDAAGNDTIVIVMDKTPSNFSSSAETAYFRAILNKYVEQGKTVFVVSCEGVASWVSVKDGVRYINLPDLWKTNGSLNTNFSMLKLRVSGSDVNYQVVKVQ